MPGVNIVTATRSGPASTAQSVGARYFVAGMTERGPVDRPLVVRSLQQYIDVYGDRVPYGYLYDDLRTHFEEGGMEAAVIRVVGPAATASQAALNDRAGSPAQTLQISAAFPGSWGTRLQVSVANGTASNTYDLSVLFDGRVVETYPGLASPAAAVAATASSAYIRATNAGSTAPAPDNNPAVTTAPVGLAGGTDDRASVTASHYVAALALFRPELGTGCVAVPGQPSSGVGSGLLVHCRANRRIGLAAVAPGTPAGSAQNAAVALKAVAAGQGQHIGLFWPAIRIPDGATVRTITPEGYVAACRARAIGQVGGPWRAPAGAIAQARFVLAPEIDADRALGDNLNASGVSVIRTIAGTVRLYGRPRLATPGSSLDPRLSQRRPARLAMACARRRDPPLA
ncbi:hypothetical protein DQ384_36560 [Sphaerisporangium album]|uniref:Uncharacterized protein n=1 Tax=Sphaerisporangium album TaxID=509200 RepID=A0A367ESV8_9ACTN|nr:hypothetical protein [Sphaerisporangium album]RCG21131.1 hypothetical protein DQ384_36560 [Sphaerisporangium album]